MGNSERLLFIKAKFKYQLTDEPVFNQKLFLTAEDKFNSAMNFYNQSQLMKVNQVEIKSQLNKLDLLIEVQTSKLEIPYNKSEIQLLINQLLTSVDAFDKLPVIDSIYSKTKLAENLMQINEFQFIPSEKEGYLLKASSLLEQVLVTTERINDIRDKSYTLGIMSKVQAQLGNKFEQQKYLEQAAELAQSVEAWDIAYKWQSQLGFLYQQAGENEKADKAYQSAIESLDYTQSSVVASNPEFNFTFKEKIAPIYQQYIELLLSQKQADLHRVIRVLEKLKSAEIQTFIRCGKIPIFSLLTNETGKTLPPAIYLIKSRNIEVIVKDEKGFLYRNTVDINLVNKEITNLSNIINSGNFTDIKEDRIIRYTNALYNLLLSPVKQYLPDSGNLIFVIDSFFQNLPLSMLHDGKKYLIESYNISISTGSQFIPNSELNKDIKVLAGGISEVNPSFKSNIVTHIFQPLPEVKKEIESIKQIVPTSILLNKDFTQENLKNKFQNEVLKIVHLSTHGQFSSDPEQTFILSWDSLLNISAIKNMLENKRSIIDLLVLNACQTAKGDRNSLLGIAGITSQTGARSTLATLWVIESESTVKLMTEFYKSLKIGLPKAAALRKAQLALISDSKYSHPYYWAALVLVGSWV